jgi:hypothetical protein
MPDQARPVPRGFTSPHHGRRDKDARENLPAAVDAVMSRNEARRRSCVDGQIRATAHLGSRRDSGVTAKVPMACRDIAAVMYARRSRVDVVRTRRHVVCVMG